MRTYRVPSVERAFKILDEIGSAGKGLTLAEVTEKTGIAKTTAFMVLTVLERVDAVRQVEGRYFLGSHLATLGGQALQRFDFRSIAEPVMEELSQKTGFTVHLGVLDHRNVIFVGKIESEGFIRFSSYVGLAQPFHVSSLGKAIVAFLPSDRIDELLKYPLERRTPYTITDPQDLREALAVIKAQGYAVEDEEDEEGVRCIGAPIFDHRNDVAGAISVTAVRADLPVESFPAVSQLVIQAAQRVSQRLGASLRLDVVPRAGDD
ncbi:MAG: IclR family transcriptional regulator [Firmicutes bacterium]|nr:IclR family transcriptional regulator [Bacillota bacterium]